MNNPTQLQLCNAAHRKIADHFEIINWLSQQENRPTKEELTKLRQKNPALWNLYPEVLAS
jgi:predicted Abi (CAAX) family protease